MEYCSSLSWPNTSALCSEDILANTEVKGFPVISADGKNILMGFIDRSQLRYVLGMFSPGCNVLELILNNSHREIAWLAGHPSRYACFLCARPGGPRRRRFRWGCCWSRSWPG